MNHGAFAALAAYVLWGLSSLYWRLLAEVPAVQLLSFRVVLSLLVLLVLLAASGQMSAVRSAGRQPRTLLIYGASGLAVAVNWAAFMWGSIHGHVIETGLGYLLAPLVSVAFGVVVLRERLSRARGMAVALMVAGVAILILRSGELSTWVYLTIGLSFGVFSLLRKLGSLGPLTGLTLESALLTGAVGLGMAGSAVSLDHVTVAPAEQLVLLSLCGIVSVGPLWLFSVASRSLRLADLGFFQYALPTTQFILAVTVYGQAFSAATLVSLAIIWAALAIVVVSSFSAAAQDT